MSQGHLDDRTRRLKAPGRHICNNQQGVYALEHSAVELLRTGLPVNDGDIVILSQHLNPVSQQVIDGAETARLFRSAHSEEIETFCRHKGVFHHGPDVLIGNTTLHLWVFDYFPANLAHALSCARSEGIGQAWARIRINRGYLP